MYLIEATSLGPIASTGFPRDTYISEVMYKHIIKDFIGVDQCLPEWWLSHGRPDGSTSPVILN